MSTNAEASGRDWRRIALVVGIAIVMVLALLAGALWLYTENLYRTSYESSYTYDLAINTNETLTNATLFLPVPVADDGSDLGGAMVQRGNAIEGNLSYRVVDTRYGPMLRVTAERVTVTPTYYEFVERNGTRERVEIPASEYDPADLNMTKDANAGTLLSVTVPVNESVETAEPWGVEPLFNPRTDRRPTACDSPAGEWLQCYGYDTKVYAQYETKETAQVDILTYVEGQNAWWVFGWNYDAYRDGVSLDLRGPQDGWMNATGHVEVDVDQRKPPRGRE